MKCSREAIDPVRSAEAKRAEGDRQACKVIKGPCWLLPRNIESQDDRIRLYGLLEANRNLMKVNVLKEDMKQLWDFRYLKAAKRFWKDWRRRAMQSGIEQLRRFAKRLKPYVPGIVAHCRHRLHTSLLEGINNKIKVIKRMAYGFRGDAYFFLKIRAAFPGIPR